MSARQRVWRLTTDGVFMINVAKNDRGQLTIACVRVGPRKVIARLRRGLQRGRGK
jgi:hypothetical protein